MLEKLFGVYAGKISRGSQESNVSKERGRTSAAGEGLLCLGSWVELEREHAWKDIRNDVFLMAEDSIAESLILRELPRVSWLILTKFAPVRPAQPSRNKAPKVPELAAAAVAKGKDSGYL